MNAARIALAGSLLASGAALCANPPVGAKSAKPAAPSGAELVAARQAGMDMSASAVTLLKNAGANGVPLKNLAFPAAGLAKWAVVLPTLFSDNTRGVVSRAKPAIWTDRAGFAVKSAALTDATKALSAAIATDDRPGFDAALASTGAACKGCHESYQVQPAPAKPS